jgi:hypothetical protein
MEVIIMELIISSLIFSIGLIVSALILTNKDNNKAKDNNKTIDTSILDNKVKEIKESDNTIKETKDDEYINFINNQINTAVHEEIIDCNMNESEIKELNIKVQELKDFMINDEEYKDYSRCELKDIIEMMICHMASNITRD